MQIHFCIWKSKMEIPTFEFFLYFCQSRGDKAFYSELLPSHFSLQYRSGGEGKLVCLMASKSLDLSSSPRGFLFVLSLMEKLIPTFSWCIYPSLYLPHPCYKIWERLDWAFHHSLIRVRYNQLLFSDFQDLYGNISATENWNKREKYIFFTRWLLVATETAFEVKVCRHFHLSRTYPCKVPVNLVWFLI